MTAKHYLRKVRHLDKTVSAKMEQIEILHAQVTKTTTTLSDMPKGGGEQDKLAATIAKIVDLKRGLHEEIEEYICLKKEAIRLIDSMDDGRHRLVLTHYYLNLKTWEETAVSMNYSYRSVHYFHGQALVEFQKVLDDNIA